MCVCDFGRDDDDDWFARSAGFERGNSSTACASHRASTCAARRARAGVATRVDVMDGCPRRAKRMKKIEGWNLEYGAYGLCM